MSASFPKLSRRQWAMMLGSAPLLAQTATQAPASPEQRMEKANADVRQVSQKLAAIEVPMNIEPAFRFKA